MKARQVRHIKEQVILINQAVMNWKAENCDKISYRELGIVLKHVFKIVVVLIETRNKISKSGSPEVKENSWFLREYTATKHKRNTGYRSMRGEYFYSDGVQSKPKGKNLKKTTRKTKKDT